VGPDEGRRLHHGGFRRGSDNGASEADVCGGEASALMESITLLPEYRPKRPPSHVFEQVALMAAEESGEYF